MREVVSECEMSETPTQHSSLVERLNVGATIRATQLSLS
jgi:hypothetical protein